VAGHNHPFVSFGTHHVGALLLTAIATWLAVRLVRRRPTALLRITCDWL
jgi:hypothetical protein